MSRDKLYHTSRSLVKKSCTKQHQARMPSPKPFPEQLKLLAREKGVSIGGVGYQAYSPTGRGTSPDTLRKVMAGKRKLNDALIEAIANVLEVPPQSFIEYRLSQLRRALDEDPKTGVGFENAARLLQEIERAFGNEWDAPDPTLPASLIAAEREAAEFLGRSEAKPKSTGRIDGARKRARGK